MAQLGWAGEQAPLQAKRADQQKQNLKYCVLMSSRQGFPRRIQGFAAARFCRPQLVLRFSGKRTIGAMYKRNRHDFLRNLPEPHKQELLQGLKQDYQVLLRGYFGQADTAEEALEHFVSTAFSADVPAQLLVKIHIQVVDQLATQLKMEGHSTAFLKDYRLALIDVMARLTEMYRNAMAVDQSSSQPTRSPETA